MAQKHGFLAGKIDARAGDIGKADVFCAGQGTHLVFTILSHIDEQHIFAGAFQHVVKQAGGGCCINAQRMTGLF